MRDRMKAALWKMFYFVRTKNKLDLCNNNNIALILWQQFTLGFNAHYLSYYKELEPPFSTWFHPESQELEPFGEHLKLWAKYKEYIRPGIIWSVFTECSKVLSLSRSWQISDQQQTPLIQKVLVFPCNKIIKGFYPKTWSQSKSHFTMFAFQLKGI